MLESHVQVVAVSPVSRYPFEETIEDIHSVAVKGHLGGVERTRDQDKQNVCCTCARQPYSRVQGAKERQRE